MLHNLPAETIDYFATFLRPADTYALALVQSRYRTAAQRALFRVVRFPDGDSTIELLLFLRTILNRPELGRFVQALETGAGYSEPNGHSNGSTNYHRIARALDRALPHLISLQRFSFVWPVYDSALTFSGAPTTLQWLRIAELTRPADTWLQACTNLRHLTINVRSVPLLLPILEKPRVVPTSRLPALTSICADILTLCALVPGRPIASVAMSIPEPLQIALDENLGQHLARTSRTSGLKQLCFNLEISDMDMSLAWKLLEPFSQLQMSALESLTIQFFAPNSYGDNLISSLEQLLDTFPGDRMSRLASLRLWYIGVRGFRGGTTWMKGRIDMFLDYEETVLVEAAFARCPSLRRIEGFSRVPWFRHNSGSEPAVWLPRPGAVLGQAVNAWLKSQNFSEAHIEWVQRLSPVDEDGIIISEMDAAIVDGADDSDNSEYFPETSDDGSVDSEDDDSEAVDSEADDGEDGASSGGTDNQRETRSQDSDQLSEASDLAVPVSTEDKRDTPDYANEHANISPVHLGPDHWKTLMHSEQVNYARRHAQAVDALLTEVCGLE
ncbi:hypothetical protein BKA62DRAFT_756069 [Auriculariales sp. MPI-PUGE-AT-0066]|nr:hypothetical protein BKA62DRAFT_756069 [Auriculariales sp. MPI-PUGE-AT-0066]